MLCSYNAMSKRNPPNPKPGEGQMGDSKGIASACVETRTWKLWRSLERHVYILQFLRVGGGVERAWGGVERVL